MGDEQASNVHSLDEWRAQQRHRDAADPTTAWMRRQRLRERRAARAGGRRGAASGWRGSGGGRSGRSYGYPYGQRTGPARRSTPGQQSGHSHGLKPGQPGRGVVAINNSSAYGARSWNGHVDVRSRPTNGRTWRGSPDGTYGGRTFGQRLVSVLVWTSSAVVLVATLLLWSALPSRTALPEPLPPLLRLWAAIDDEDVAALRSVLEPFEREHGVQVELYNNLPPSYDLLQTLMSSYSPDVLLIDAEMTSRLLALDALQPLWEPEQANAEEAATELSESDRSEAAFRSDDNHSETLLSDAPAIGERVDNPAAYVLQLAEESLWVRSLRAVIPLHARDAALARQFIAYIAELAHPDSPTHGVRRRARQ